MSISIPVRVHSLFSDVQKENWGKLKMYKLFHETLKNISWHYFCMQSCCFQSSSKFYCWDAWETCSCLILLFLDDWAGNVYAAFIMVTYWLSMCACCCLWYWNNELACRWPWEGNVMNGFFGSRFFGSKLYLLQGCCVPYLYFFNSFKAINFHSDRWQ